MGCRSAPNIIYKTFNFSINPRGTACRGGCSFNLQIRRNDDTSKCSINER